MLPVRQVRRSTTALAEVSSVQTSSRRGRHLCRHPLRARGCWALQHHAYLCASRDAARLMP